MKLFVSTGSLLPMDRLLKAVDAFLEKNVDYSCIAQFGDSNLKSSRMKTQEIFEEKEFRQHFQTADVIISHAGMGNILMSVEYAKPIIVMPRRAELNENINNHQADTVKGLQDKHFVRCINESDELEDAILWAKSWKPAGIPHTDMNALISSIKEFITDLD